MQRYLIETPHTAETCRLMINEVRAMGYLNHFDWGCDAGVHSGWAIIEAESEAEARLAVPLLVRKEARVVPLVKYSPDGTVRMHEE